MTTYPRCLECIDHPGWNSADLAARREPQDLCKACLGLGVAVQSRPVPWGFWPQINHQLARIADDLLDTFDDVRAVLLDPVYDAVVADVNLNDVRHFDADTAFFAGSGGDATLQSALRCAGWGAWRFRAPYYWAMTHPGTGEDLTYIEGDVLRGDRIGERIRPDDAAQD